MRLPFLHSEGWTGSVLRPELLKKARESGGSVRTVCCVAVRLPRRAQKRQEKTEMIESELNNYKKVLKAKQAELGQLVRNRDGIAIETSPDALDEVQYAAERELAIRNLDRDSSVLRKVSSALLRIEDGSFGVCLHCEEDISPKRLAAVPWTAFCIQCQEIADRRQADDNFDELLVNAA
jgi:DnaK suppressor protein